MAPELPPGLRKSAAGQAVQQHPLNQAQVQPMLPVRDLDAAKEFYERKLGLTKVSEMGGEAVVYRSGGSELCVYRSKYAGTNKGTAAMWQVADVEPLAQELKGKGISFEHYDDLPGMTRKGDVHAADGMKVAWFKDPSGNILSIQSSG